MRAPRRVHLAATTAAVATFALAACSSTTESPDPSGSATTGGETTPHELRLATSTAPGNFQIGEWSGGDATLFLSVYDTVFIRELDGTIAPGLAESWEYSDDRLTLTLNIRGGQEFSNGEPVDAAAVATSLQAAREGSSTAGGFASVANVEATDEATVVVTLSTPDAALVPLLTGISGAVGAPSVIDAESSQLTPIGSGPYVLDGDQTVTGASYVLVKDEDNWNADAYPFDTVEIEVIEDNTAVINAVLAGQIDATGVGSEQELAQFPADKFTSGKGNPSTVAALWLIDRDGVIVPQLADVRVRQAINLAIDRELIAANLNPGATEPTNQVVSPLGDAFDEALFAQTAFNIDEAKALMAEAGYPDGFAVTMPSTVLTTAYESILAQQLAQIGIEVTWEPVAFQDFFASLFQAKYGMFFMYNGLTASDPQDVSASLAGIFNPLGSTTPELQELLATANASSEENQPAAYSAINEYLVDQAWFAPIGLASGFYVHSNDVTYTPPVVGSQNVRGWAPAGS